jgi:hypothetical protein
VKRPGTAPTRRDTDRVLVAAGGTYVVAWLVGLVAAPARPTTTADEALAGFLREHDGPLLAQSVLVHGVAGAALLVVAVRAGRALASRASMTTGVAAASLSFLQVALLAAAVVSAARRADGVAAGSLAAVDGVDSAKLLALAGFAFAASRAGRRSGALPTWVQVLGGTLALLLVLGAASFVPALGSPLRPTLVAALPVLLTHVAAVAVLMARRRADLGAAEVWG